MDKLSRKEALDRGLTRYITGKPCIYGHIAERLSSNWICVECNRENVKESGKKTPERVATNKRRSGRKNAASKKERRLVVTKGNDLADMVRKAVGSGVLAKLPCFCCGSLSSEGHHPNYDEPLSVVWLCRKHHLEIHNGI